MWITRIGEYNDNSVRINHLGELAEQSALIRYITIPYKLKVKLKQQLYDDNIVYLLIFDFVWNCDGTYQPYVRFFLENIIF